MKKILLALLTTTAWAISSGDKATFSNKYNDGRNPDAINYIKNPSCLRNAVNVTGTNTTPSRNTTTPLTSIADCQSTLDSATDTIDWATATLDRNLKNGNCEVGIRYKLTLGSGNTIQLQARINSATVASADLVTSDNGTAVVNFPCGDLSNAPSLRIAQTAGSSSQAINVANVYLGAARNIGTVAQAQLYGTWNMANQASCSFSITQNAFTNNYSSNASCPTPTVTGSVSAAPGKIPGISVSGPGRYLVYAQGRGASNVTNSLCGFRLSDGTTTQGNSPAYSNAGISHSNLSLMGSFEYNDNTARTIQIQGAWSVTSGACNIWNDQVTDNLQFIVYRFPSSSEIAVRNGQTPAWGATTWGPNVASASDDITGSSYETFSNANFATRTNYGSATTGASTSDLSLKIPNLPAGTYQVFAIGHLIVSVGSDATCAFKITDGTNNIGPIEVRTSSVGNASTIGSVITYTSQADRTFSIQARAVSASPTCRASADSADKQITLAVLPVGMSLPAPILVGSVTSNSTGAERVERAQVTTICTSSPCTIASQSGSWLTSITRTGTGAYSANFATGMFSAAPSCQVIATGGTNLAIINGNLSATPSSTAFTWTSYGLSTATPEDSRFNITCQGPR